MSLHGYHIANNTFPTGGVFQRRELHHHLAARLVRRHPPLAGTARGLVHGRFRCRRRGQANAAAGAVLLKIYICPSEPRPAPSSFFNDGYTDADYGGMYGERGLSSPQATNNPPTGPMIFNQPISITDITDGTAQTIQVGEDPEAINGIWIGGHNVFDQSAAINACPPTEFGEELTSPHPGGVNTLFADGSVPFPAPDVEFAHSRRPMHATAARQSTNPPTNRIPTSISKEDEMFRSLSCLFVLALPTAVLADMVTTFEDLGLPANSYINNAGSSGLFVSGGNSFNNSYSALYMAV